MKVDVGLPGQVHRGLQSCFGEGKTSKAVGVQYMMKTHEHAVSFLGECVLPVTVSKQLYQYYHILEKGLQPNHHHPLKPGNRINTN